MESEQASEAPNPARRRLLARATWLGMGAGLAAAYGTLGAFAVRFLYPARGPRREWRFVSELARLQPGQSLSYRTPTGERVAIARHGTSGDASDFAALSSTCPHLGCQVHWEPQNTRFFCPCHNGVFDPQGRALSGPPADEGQSLPRYALKVEGGLLYIQVATERVA